MPVLEGADEAGHFCHTEYIAHRQRLPDLTYPDGCFLVYQPLYYVLLTPVIGAFGLPEASYKKLQKNPNFELLREGEYAQFVHDRDELLFRWDSFEVMVHLLRVFSSVYALIIFLLAWKVSKNIFKNPINRNLSMLLFFNPMFLHIFTTLTNVTLVTLLASLFIAVEIVYAKREKPLKITAVQGVILGLGLLTKISILGVGLAYTGIFLWRWRKIPRSVKFKIQELAAFGGGIFLVAGWYMYRSLKLYGEPLEVNVVRPYAGEHHWTLLSELGFLNFWNSFADTVFRTFWSGFGALTVNFPLILNLVILMLTFFTAYSVFGFRKKMNTELKVSLYYFLSAFIFLVVVNVRTSSMHAKDLFTAYLPLGFLFSFGLANFVAYLKRQSIPTVPRLLILVISGYFFAQTQIVELAKWLYQSMGFWGFYKPQTIEIGQTFLVLMLKIIVLFLIYKVLIYLFSMFTINSKTVKGATFALTAFNLLVLVISVYLFYARFL